MEIENPPGCVGGFFTIYNVIKPRDRGKKFAK